MDRANIVSKFMTGIVSRITKTIISKKLGYDIDIRFNEIKVSVDDGKTHVSLGVDAEVEKDELLRILKDFGMN